MSFQGLPNQVANITDIPGVGWGYEKFQKISFPHPTLEGTYVLDPYPARFFYTFAKRFILGTKLGAEGP